MLRLVKAPAPTRPAFLAVLFSAAVQFWPAALFAAEITVTIVEPTPGRLSGEQLRVVATVASALQLSTVTANVEGRQIPMLFSTTAYCIKAQCFNPGWVGTVSLAGLVRGPKTATVIATDIAGGSATATAAFVFDRLPEISVSQPGDETVARPNVRLALACTDDDPQGCTSLTVLGPSGEVLAAGVSSLANTVSLAQYEGTTVNLAIRAVDSAGSRVQVDRAVHVESSRRLGDPESVPGRILDVTPDRILFLNGSSLNIRTRATGTDTPVPAVDGKTLKYGFLTPVGAIFVAQGADVLTAGVYDWRGSGAPLSLGLPNSAQSLTVSGQFAIWTGERGPQYTGQVVLFRRDLLAGSTVEIGSEGIGNTENGVAPSGDVAFWTRTAGYNVSRYRGGTVTRLTNDSSSWNVYPITDGINVVYRKQSPCCTSVTSAITLYGSSGELTLAAPRAAEASPRRDYAAHNGWTAFTKLETGNILQIWVRSPAGAQTQLSFFGRSATIDALGGEGEVMFAQGSRYLAGPSTPAIRIGSTLGRVFWHNGQWSVAIGNSLFPVRPDAVTPPGVPVIGAVVPGNTTASVSFSAPADNGGSAITGYTATCRGLNTTRIASGPASPILVTGLPNGVSVTCTVLAMNAAGDSLPSADSVAVTPATVPGAPSMGLATAGDGQVTVSFGPPSSNGGSPILRYTVTCGERNASGPGSPLVVTGLPNGVAVTCRVLATNGAGNSEASPSSNSVTPGPQGVDIPRLVNISTRARVQTGDDVLIAGFIIGGDRPKKVLIAARGPSLALPPFNVPGTIGDPFLQLFSGSTQIDFNDDYGTRPNASEIPLDKRPGDAKEAAILTTLAPGAYTAIVTGVGATTGVAIAEVFEIEHPELPLVNISARSRVETGDNVMIAGFVIHGVAPKRVLVTARGPSLASPPFNVPGTLTDPYLWIHQVSSGQTLIFENDNWEEGANAGQIPAHLRPANPRDAAMLVTLAPGAYTVIVGGGKDRVASGVAIVEVFVQ